MMRRTVGVAAYVWALCALAPVTHSQSCLDANLAFGGGLPPAISTSGSALIDAELSQMSAEVATAFRVRPRLFLFNDQGSPNAFASETVTDPSRPDGTVMVGLGLLQEEYQRWLIEYGGRRYTYGMLAVIAHEYAHILQAQKGAQHPTMSKEIEADFMAGWFIGSLAAAYPMVNVRDGMEAFFTKGDYEFNNPTHHGTPQQRLAAFLAGMQKSGESRDDAFGAAEAYVSSDGGTSEPVATTNVQLQIAPITIGAIGAVVGVWIDGQPVGSLSNMTGPYSLTIPNVTLGQHTFTLEAQTYTFGPYANPIPSTVVNGGGIVMVQSNAAFRVAGSGASVGLIPIP